MERYKFFIDPVTGQTTEATTEQIESQQEQILCIAGLEAVIPPPIWVGPYDGQMLFLPSKFESLDGMSTLHIRLGNTLLVSIKNVGPSKYEIYYAHNDEMIGKIVDKLYAELISLTKL